MDLNTFSHLAHLKKEERKKTQKKPAGFKSYMKNSLKIQVYPVCKVTKA